MNKLYLLPVSLLLLNPSFAEDNVSSPAASDVKIIAVEEAENHSLGEIAVAETPLAEAGPTGIEIDPRAIEQLQAEIAAMLQEKSPALEEPVVETTLEKEVASLEGLQTAPMASDREQEPLLDEEQEIALEEDENFEEDALEETPRINLDRRTASSPAEYTPRTFRNENEQLAEKEPGSHVRRYSTKPSKAPKVHKQTAGSEYERPVQKRPASPVKRQNVKPSIAPKVQERVADSEYQRPVQKKPASPVKRQSVKPSIAPKVQERVADSEYQRPVQKKPASPVKRQSVKPSIAPKVQERVADSEYQQPVQKKQSLNKRRPAAPAAKAPAAEAPTGQIQQKGPMRKQPSQAAPQNHTQAKKSAPSQRSPAATAPNANAQAPRTNQSPSAQGRSQQKQTAPLRAPEKKTQAPQKKQMTKKAPAARKNNAAAPNNSAARPQTGDLKQKRIAQDESQGQMNPNGQMPPQDQMNSQGQMNSSGQMDSKRQAGMKQNGQSKANGMMYNTAARPVVKDGYNVWVMGDTLLWQAVEENLTYVYTGNDELNERNRNLHTLDFEWDWGFRLGAGYNAKRDGWDIGLYWTHIRNTAHGSQHSTPEKALFEIWGVAAHLLNGTVNTAKSDWRVHLDQVDLDLGREFYVGKFLTVRPFVGLRSDWIFQEYEVELKGTATGTGAELEQESKLKNRFWGFGFVAGLDTDWMLGWGFSIYGDADMSILMGFFDIDQKGTQNDVKIWSQDKSFRTGRAILDLGLGLKWSRLFWKDRFGMTLKAGYEYHLYFNQNQFILSSGTDNFELFNPVKGDLTYQGVIGTIQFDF